MTRLFRGLNSEPSNFVGCFSQADSSKVELTDVAEEAVWVYLSERSCDQHC